MVSVAGSSKIIPTEPEEGDRDWWEISSAEVIALILDWVVSPDTLTRQSS